MTEAFKVQIDIPVKRDHVVDPETNQKYEIIDLIQSEVLLKDLFNLEQVRLHLILLPYNV